MNTESLVGKKILWVEDDPFLSTIIKKKLSNEQCEVIYAKEGAEALALTTSEKPDIVVLDIMLPGMSGYDILSGLKRNEATRNIPVILLSNLGQPSDVEKGMNLGATKFLVKAINTLDQIIGEIKKSLS